MQGNDFTRFRHAITQEAIPDRVPVAECDIDFAIMDAYLGRPVLDLATYVAFWEQAGYDYVLLEIRSQYIADSYQKRIAQGVRYVETHESASVSTSGSVIHDEKTFYTYPWTKPQEVYYRDIDLVRECMPDSMKVILCVGPIYNGIQRAMGMNSFIKAYAEDPTLIRAVADKFGTSAVRIVENVLQREWVGGVWLGDDIAHNTGLMVSPGFLRDYVFPYYQRIGQLCRMYDKLFIYHSDGNRDQVLPDLVDCGIQALHPNEPLAGDIGALKQQWGKHFALIGNVDVDLMERGTPEQVSAAARKLIDDLAPGGGFVLGSGNSITKDTPLANYRALLNAARLSRSREAVSG